MNERSSSLIAGVMAGIAGLLTFLVIHQVWITPIWFILPAGLVIASLGGLAVGWAYSELYPRLPRRPWTILAWLVLIGLILAPSIVIAQLSPPRFSGAGMNVTATISLPQAILILVVDLLLTAAITGGLAGWLIGRTKRSALATALAGLIFAVGPGHNIPFLGNTPATGKGIALLVAIIMVATVVLVEGQAALARERPGLAASPRENGR
ncbi:MAG TPA: hypothetical protein VF498_02410 [Anaerolineales bacterium]